MKETKETLQNEIIDRLKTANKPLRIEDVTNGYTDKAAVNAAISELLLAHSVVLTKKKKLAMPDNVGLVAGKIQAHARGFGFFIPDDGTQDLFVPAEAMHGAMNGDAAWARMTEFVSRNGSPEAEIAYITQRAKKQIVGAYESDGRMGGYIVPDDPHIPMDMIVPIKHAGKARAGDKVVAEILEYPDGRRPMLGRVTEVLGNKNVAGTDVLSIIKQYELPEKFSGNALRMARQIPPEVAADETLTHESLVGKLIFTIDGADAKDLDDAISLEKLKNGNYYLGVHIADVAHYVQEGSALDRDALTRGTSVYLADRVLPMLPVELSNGICSLHPDVERLTLSCFMEVDASGKVLRHRLSETVIRSKYRLVYEDVTRLLQGDETLRERYKELVPVLEELHTLAQALNARRSKRGSIDFDLPEAKITLDDGGHPTQIRQYPHGIANKMIEECMLLANETVAEHMYNLKSPFLYRVHEAPDKEKITDVNAFIQTLGYGIRNVSDLQPRNIQRVLNAVKGTREENIINKVVLRAMQKARYSERCLGHFGLAAPRYCHFTSPIRRYPDLVVHRVIKLMLHGTLTLKEVGRLNERMPGIADACSRHERAAMEAERAVDDLKKCEYMRDHIGDDYEGIISGVANYGFFVELANTVEGLVRANTLHDDYYTFEEKTYRLAGRKNGRVFRLGDAVRVCVTAVHMDARNIDFELSE
ncbi:MAG: ribonuclease R [Clostridiales bacterium]|jgi:ribonuclease R|nr:ribonuclease R [Clostridiales bacterium]